MYTFKDIIKLLINCSNNELEYLYISLVKAKKEFDYKTSNKRKQNETLS